MGASYEALLHLLDLARRSSRQLGNVVFRVLHNSVLSPYVTPDTPIRAIPQSGAPIRESDATIREWELLYESGPRFPIARYLGIGAEGAKVPPYVLACSALYSLLYHTLYSNTIGSSLIY
jgi:hypothetical protein